MASRNGLNPKIKGSKGVGFGRALPSAFGFGNGIVGNNSVPYISFPTIVGTPFLSQFTIEFWIKIDTHIPNFEGYLEIVDGSGEYGRIQGQPPGSGDLAFKFENTNLQGSTSGDNLIENQRNHVVYTLDFVNGPFLQVTNGGTSTKAVGGLSKPTSYNFGNISAFNIIGCPQKLGLYSTKCIDEFRMYTGIISDLEIETNYNNGYGANPSKTEQLITWLTFEKFENLDFSAMQDGSNMHIGIRDMSNKNNHGQANGMNLDPSSQNYSLKVF